MAADARGLIDAGVDLRLFPMLPAGGIVHADAARFVGRTEAGTLRSSVRLAAKGTLAEPRAIFRGGLFAATNGVAANRVRNLSVLPRAAALTEIVRRLRPSHLHVHWGGASSTVAMIAAEATGISWSMTLHRWDIHANNLLARKLASGFFHARDEQIGRRAVGLWCQDKVSIWASFLARPPSNPADRDAPAASSVL